MIYMVPKTVKNMFDLKVRKIEKGFASEKYKDTLLTHPTESCRTNSR